MSREKLGLKVKGDDLPMRDGFSVVKMRWRTACEQVIQMQRVVTLHFNVDYDENLFLNVGPDRGPLFGNGLRSVAHDHESAPARGTRVLGCGSVLYEISPVVSCHGLEIVLEIEGVPFDGHHHRHRCHHPHRLRYRGSASIRGLEGYLWERQAQADSVHPFQRATEKSAKWQLPVCRTQHDSHLGAKGVKHYKLYYKMGNTQKSTCNGKKWNI